MTFTLKHSFASLFTSLAIVSCGGSSSGGGATTPPPALDRTAPSVSFGSAPTTVESESSVTVNVNATDNVGVTSGPTVTCDNGGGFAGSTFTAPAVVYDASVTCTATAGDAAGNTGTATLTIEIKAPVEVVLPKSQLFESELFVIEKTSPPGDIEITQLSGTEAIVFTRYTTTSTLFRAPSLDFDGREQLSFEVKVTGPNGESASTIIAAPEVIGRAGVGIPVAIYEPALSLKREAVRSFNSNVNVGPNIIATRRGKDSFNSDKFEVVMIGGGIDSFRSVDYENETTYLVEGLFDNINYITPGALAGALGTFSGLSVLSKSNDELNWLRLERTEQDELKYTESDSFSIQDPCYVRGPSNSGQDYVLVGQENNGFSVIALERTPRETNPVTGFDETLIQNIGAERSLCYIFATKLPRNIKFPDGGFGFSKFDDLITFDYKSNDMVLFADPQNDQSYEEVGVIPLQTNSTETLQIIDVYAYGAPSQVYRSLVVLLTNGEDGGVHRLINIIQDDDEDQKITQKTYSWTGGVPVALVEGNFGGNDKANRGFEDFVVITNSNQSLFFENNSVLENNSVKKKDYAEPVLFETFPGAGSAVSVSQRNSVDFVDIEDVLVSYPDTGELRIYTPDPTLPKFQQPDE